MDRRKSTKRIDPRYFLHETAYRDLEEQEKPTWSPATEPARQYDRHGWPSMKISSIKQSWYSQERMKYAPKVPVPAWMYDNPVFKVPGESLYFQLSPIMTERPSKKYRNKIDKQFVTWVLAAAHNPYMESSREVAKIDPSITPGPINSPGDWVGKILSQKIKGDVVEILPPAKVLEKDYHKSGVTPADVRE